MTESAGAIIDGKHVFPIRVYFEDTDAAGIVYYANYLKFAERARTEFLRLAGAPHREFMDNDNIMLAVRRCEVDYLRPATLDDALEVHSEIVELRGASMRADQAVRRGDTELARLRLRLACITRDGRPAKIPDRLMAVLEPYCNAPSTPFQQRV